MSDRYEEVAVSILHTAAYGTTSRDIAAILRKPFPEPAPAEQGEGRARMAELYAKAMRCEDSDWRDGYLDAIQDFERKPIASRPQPAAAQDVREPDDIETVRESLRELIDVADEECHFAAAENGSTALDALARLASARNQGDAREGAEGDLAAALRIAAEAEARAELAERTANNYWDLYKLSERKGEEMGAALKKCAAVLAGDTTKNKLIEALESARAALATPADGDMCASCICEMSCMIPMKHHMRVCDDRETTPAEGTTRKCETCRYFDGEHCNHKCENRESWEPIAEGTTREGEPCLVCHHVEIDYKPVCRHCGATRYISALAHEAPGEKA
jgi:hypothetical protein